jgi:uncharacterized membrane protein
MDDLFTVNGLAGLLVTICVLAGLSVEYPGLVKTILIILAVIQVFSWVEGWYAARNK